MRRSLPRRMHELREAAAALQRLGWTVERIALECEESEQGLWPRGIVVVRFEPPRDVDTL